MTFRLLAALLAASVLAPAETHNVVIITADGLRRQELFAGIDPVLMNEKAAAMDKAAALREKYWRPTAEERRAVLMPFLWTKLARSGVVLGNTERNSSVRVTNAYRVSYPGYSEILTGRAQDAAIRGNDPVQNPTPTVLEYAREKLGLTAKQVALFGSWGRFRQIAESRPGALTVNAGYQEADGSPRTRELSALQYQALTPWQEVRHDYVTLELALDYMVREQPRLIYIGLGETDDWAHDRRYDRVLDTVRYFDDALRRVWEAIERTPAYRGRTAVIVTTDHGRGARLDDWHGHGAKVEGADRIWAVVAGPDTPATGEAKDTPPAFQRDIAPTVLHLLGLDWRAYPGIEGKPLPLSRRE